MALYQTPPGGSGACYGSRSARRFSVRSGGIVATVLAALAGFSSTPVDAQVTASGTMISAPAAASSATGHIVYGVADSIPKAAQPNPGTSPRPNGLLPMAQRPLIEHPGMPSLPVIPPPRVVSIAVSGGMAPNPHANDVKTVELNPTTASTGGAPTAQIPPPVAVSANPPAITATNVGQIPPPRIDPNLGQEPPVASASSSASAPPANVNGFENVDAIRAAAEQFLRQQTAGLPGQVSIVVLASAPHGLTACDSLDAFVPPGAHLWGRTTVGVHCVGAKPWTSYLQARIAVNATYFVASHEIAPGEVIVATDLAPRQGDLTNLPRTVVTDQSQIVGKSSLERIGPGLLLRQDMLRSVALIQAGQSVKLLVQGSGFSISYEGSALTNGAAGDSVKVRTPSGQVVSGVVKDRDTVEIPL